MNLRTSRRSFLASSSAWAAATSFGFSKSPDHCTISILHTTDLHGHILPTRSYTGLTDLGGFARCATQIRTWRKQNPNSILVDIGDLYQGTPESFNNQGKLFVELLGNFNYDAWVLGNHDFDWGPEALEKNIATSKTSILAANLFGLPEQVLPWKMIATAGFNIALIGLVTPGLSSWIPPETLGSVVANQPAAALKKSIAQAQSARADAIVVLAHFGLKNIDDFANPLHATLLAAPGVDALIAGHTHTNIPSLQLGGTLFTQANHFGIHCGKLDLTFDQHSRKLIAKTATTELMDARITLDPSVIHLSQPALNSASEQLSRKLTNLAAPILGNGRDSPLARLLCRAFLTALKNNNTPADAVFHGTFGTPQIPAGLVTVAQAWEILPYENSLITAALTPAQLLEILAEDHTTGSDRTLWPFEVVYEKAKPVKILHNSRELDPSKTYTIAFNTYDSQSAGQALPRLRETIEQPSAHRKLTTISTRNALIEAFLAM